ARQLGANHRALPTARVPSRLSRDTGEAAAHDLRRVPQHAVLHHRHRMDVALRWGTEPEECLITRLHTAQPNAAPISSLSWNTLHGSHPGSLVMPVVMCSTTDRPTRGRGA